MVSKRPNLPFGPNFASFQTPRFISRSIILLIYNAVCISLSAKALRKSHEPPNTLAHGKPHSLPHLPSLHPCSHIHPFAEIMPPTRKSPRPLLGSSRPRLRLLPPPPVHHLLFPLLCATSCHCRCWHETHAVDASAVVLRIGSNVGREVAGDF